MPPRGKNRKSKNKIYNIHSIRTNLNISSVTESGSNGAAGQKMTIDYCKYNTSVFRTSGQNDQYGDDDDSFITYQFDNTGKTIAVKEDTADNKALGASKYSYTANSSSKPKSNNKLQTAIPLGRSTNNMASNGYKWV